MIGFTPFKVSVPPSDVMPSAICTNKASHSSSLAWAGALTKKQAAKLTAN
jgi:hypothetical protein